MAMGCAVVTRCQVKVIVHSSEAWSLLDVRVRGHLNLERREKNRQTDCQTEVRTTRSIMIFDGAAHYPKESGTPQRTLGLVGRDGSPHAPTSNAPFCGSVSLISCCVSAFRAKLQDTTAAKMRVGCDIKGTMGQREAQVHCKDHSDQSDFRVLNSN